MQRRTIHVKINENKKEIKMKAKELIEILKSKGYAVSKGETFYVAGEGYPKRYELVSSIECVTTTPYLMIPCKSKSHGFWADPRGNVNSFFSGTENGFQTTKHLSKFLESLPSIS